LRNYDMIISNFSLIDENDKILKEKFYKKKPFLNNYIFGAFRPGYTGCAMAFRKEMLKYILPFPNDVSCGHDNWTGICVKKFGNVIYIDEPLFQHRIHKDNFSGMCKKSPNNLLQKINLRISLLINIILRKKLY